MKLQAKVNLLKNQTGNVKALASVNLNDEFVINDLRVMDGSKGLWVSMPSKKGKDGKYSDIFHPISAKSRLDIFDCILKEYEKKVDSEGDNVEKEENIAKKNGTTSEADEVPF